MAVQLVWMAMLLSAAAESTIKKHDPVVVGQTFMAGGSDASEGSTGWALTSHGVAEKLYTVNANGEVVPQIAQSITGSGTSWTITLKPDYKFSDGTAVTAQIVAAALTKLNEKNDGAKSLGKMTVTTPGDLTVKIDTELGTPVLPAVLAGWAFCIFLEKDGKFLYTGPYAIETHDDKQIKLAPNVHYPRAVERPLLTIKKYSSGESAAADVQAGKLDMGFHLPVDTLPQLRQTSGVTVKSFLVGYQYMMWYNTRRAPLDDIKVRKALDVAIDRTALTQAIRAGKGTRSFFPENTPWHLKDSHLHGDKSEAEKLLDEAGWVKNAKGIREKDGKPMELASYAYPHRPALPVLQEEIKKTFTNLGIQFTTAVKGGDDWSEFQTHIDNKDFDCLFWAQNTLPAGDPLSFIDMFFRSSGGNNFAGLESDDIDKKIDALSEAAIGNPRLSASSTAQEAILEQVPVSVLMTPSWHVAMGERLADYEPWGSDYYIIHSSFGLPGKDPTGPQTDTADGTSVNGATQAMLSGLSVATFLLLGLMF